MNSARPIYGTPQNPTRPQFLIILTFWGFTENRVLLKSDLWPSTVVRHSSTCHDTAPWCVPDCVLLSTPMWVLPLYLKVLPLPLLWSTQKTLSFPCRQYTRAAPQSFNCSVWLLTYNTLGTGCILGYSRNAFLKIWQHIWKSSEVPRVLWTPAKYRCLLQCSKMTKEEAMPVTHLGSLSWDSLCSNPVPPTPTLLGSGLGLRRLLDRIWVAKKLRWNLTI